MHQYQAILHFWFQEIPNAAWFKKDPAFDQQIKEGFNNAFEKAVSGEYASWEEAPDSMLALVILLDQFSRNMFRDTANMFANDAEALRCTKKGLTKHFDRYMKAAQRQFFYMPLMHSESLEDQELSVKLYRMNIGGEASEFAVKHHVIIKRFGRFPHRNALLGRNSTPEEIAFLKEPNSSF